MAVHTNQILTDKVGLSARDTAEEPVDRSTHGLQGAGKKKQLPLDQILAKALEGQIKTGGRITAKAY